MTQAAVEKKLAENTGVPKKEVTAVLRELKDLAVKEVKGNAGKFKVAGIVTVKLRDKPAQPERQGRNPATGAPMTIKAKPASKAVRPLMLKAFKEEVVGAKK